MVNCWASGTWEVTCTAKSDWYFHRKHPVGDLVQYLRELGRVILAHGEAIGFSDLPAYGVAQGVLHEGLAKSWLVASEIKAFFERALFVDFLLLFSLIVGERGDEALFREELRGHVVRASTTSG